ncbi:MAG: response regulator [Pedobacter sp.]|nr:MAG: response regulator [Pedobacter sp.]
MGQKSKIMIVDDNPIDHMITKYILKHNFAIEDVTVMESAEAALSYLESKQNDLNTLPELIILDLDMPGLNGFDFIDRYAKLSKALQKTCKIVVLTGSDILADLEKIKANVYVSELINKPLSKNALLDII